MFYHNIDPVLFRVGFFEIRYYGILFLLGFVIAYFLVKYLAKKRNLALGKEDIDDLFLWLFMGIVIGSRLFYVLVYNFSFYLANPFEIIAVWHGGLSFHGGLIGAVVAIYFVCRKKKMGFFEFTDMLVIPLALALFLGRIGNFINGELIGRKTTVPWCFNFSGYEGCRHPSQLYESLKNLFIFFVLWALKDKRLPSGLLSWLFIFMYGVLRFFIGFFRAPDPQLGFIVFGLTMGQILNILMILIGAFFLLKIKKGLSSPPVHN